MSKERDRLLAYLDQVLAGVTLVDPMPDTEFARIYWDDESQSVKRDIVPAKDVYLEPSNKSDGSNG